MATRWWSIPSASTTELGSMPQAIPTPNNCTSLRDTSVRTQILFYVRVTVEDPGAYAMPFTLEGTFKLLPNNRDIRERYCYTTVCL